MTLLLLPVVAAVSNANASPDEPDVVPSGCTAPAVWTSANDGAGSCLDADTVDGVHAATILGWVDAEADARAAGDDALAASIGNESAERAAADAALATAPVDWSRLMGFPAACGGGQFVRAIGSTLVCATPAGSGTVTSVGSGFGLVGGPITTSGTLGVDTNLIQRRVASACSVGSSIRAIAPDGSVTCEAAGMPGVTSILTGSGLTGGPITTTGTISIANGGVTGAHVANGSLGGVDFDGSNLTVNVLSSTGGRVVMNPSAWGANFNLNVTSVGSYGQMKGVNFSSICNPSTMAGCYAGLALESGYSESGGFWANGDTAVIWSPGDDDLLKVMDEDYPAVRWKLDGFGNAFTVSSSTLKTNVTPIAGLDALARIQALHGVYYDYLPDATGKPMPAGTNMHTLGFIAENVAVAVPELAYVDPTGQNLPMVDYARMTALLVEALKAQQSQIDALRALVEAAGLDKTQLE